jgi:GT2 family glycosyltransferase
MKKPFISITLPAIRAPLWDDLYDSILLSCKKYSFELILCGPLPLTKKLQSKENVKYVKDLGCPTRASNIACSLAEGELITWIADDAVMIEDSLDKNIDMLLQMGNDYKNVIIQKYYEGKNGTKKELFPDNYFLINNSGNQSPYLNDNWYLFNNPLMYRKFYDELGGLDSCFEACPMAHNDLAVRAQHLGANVKISRYPILDCDHMEGGSGDHMPIFICQTNFDQPKYQMRYRNPNWILNPMRLSIDNWKNTDSIWKRRFSNGVPKDYSELLT